MSPFAKIGLATRVWWLSLVVRIRARRSPLPKLVEDLGRTDQDRVRYSMRPERMGQIVVKVLTTPAGPPRCLISSLVTFRILRQEGQPVELVIGLPRDPQDKDAHAWLELDGRDIGPPPGQFGHLELTRYG